MMSWQVQTKVSAEKLSDGFKKQNKKKQCYQPYLLWAKYIVLQPFHQLRSSGGPGSRENLSFVWVYMNCFQLLLQRWRLYIVIYCLQWGGHKQSCRVYASISHVLQMKQNVLTILCILTALTSVLPKDNNLVYNSDPSWRHWFRSMHTDKN